MLDDIVITIRLVASLYPNLPSSAFTVPPALVVFQPLVHCPFAYHFQYLGNPVFLLIVYRAEESNLISVRRRGIWGEGNPKGFHAECQGEHYGYACGDPVKPPNRK